MIFTYQGRSIYYERHGEGRPLLLLNGNSQRTFAFCLNNVHHGFSLHKINAPV